MRPITTVLLAIAVLGSLVFIGWWNWRLFAQFGDQGMPAGPAALVVFGPFALLLVWAAWRVIATRRRKSK